jgi:limonene-1,2-epoxide hydrolase
VDPKATVERLEDALRRGDLDAMYALMTDDVVYHQIPHGPVYGLAALRQKAADNVDEHGKVISIDWEVTSTAVTGNTVFVERLTRIAWGGGRRSTRPMVAVFEVRDGKIAAWRDYFDKETVAVETAR